MTTSRKLLCGAYGVVAVIAVIATWSQNVAYTGAGGVLAVLRDFWLDTRANPASRSITADIVLFTLAAVIFMVIEARKHRIRYVWAYVVGALLIAISVTFPLFLIARERRLVSESVALPLLDRALLAGFAMATIAFTWWVDCAG